MGLMDQAKDKMSDSSDEARDRMEKLKGGDRSDNTNEKSREDQQDQSQS